jgi:hypothetical protein
MGINKGAFGTPWAVGIYGFTRINHETINGLLAKSYLQNPVVKELYELSMTEDETFEEFAEILAVVAFAQGSIALPSKGNVTIRGLDRRDKDSFYMAKNLKPEAIADALILMRMLMNRDFWVLNEEFSAYAEMLYGKYLQNNTIFKDLFNKF